MTKPKILVVDDDRTTVAVITAFLRHAGYEVSTAFDALQGFTAAQRLSPALIVLDVNMPAGGGVQMLERLYRSTRTASIPVLVVTSAAEPALNAKLIEKGAGQVLAKPVESATLVQAVQQLLGETPAA